MMTEKSLHDIDLFNKQAIMNGERVPVIMGSLFMNLVNETDDKAWIGQLLPQWVQLPVTESLEQGATLPWLVQYQNCADGVALCGGRDQVGKYDAHCWVDRKDLDIDINKPRGGLLNMQPGGQASWHPGWRAHRIDSRRSAMLFLAAFKKAFDTWEEGIKTDGFPLAEKYWHVGDTYKGIRESLHKHINDEDNKSACAEHYNGTGHGAWCRVGMHGMSTFRPINLGRGNGILKNLKAAPSGYVPHDEYESYYTGPDLLPLSWKIPDGEVDVHAIAIATSYEAPLNEHLFDNTDDDDAVEDAELGRMLRTSMNEEVEESPSMNNEVVDSDRSLETSGIVPGEGWGLESQGSSPDEYCDGSPQSECGRTTKDKYYGCLLNGMNDRRNSLSGDGLSGWLVMTIPGEVKNGIIWAKLEVCVLSVCCLY